MTDPNYAQITVTELDNGSVQYDIMPHDQIEESAIVLLNQDGILSIRDQDGTYMPIAGTEIAEVLEYSPLPDFFEFLPEADQQLFEDIDTGVAITMYRNDNGSLVIDVDLENNNFSQFVGAIPTENVGFEQRTLIEGNEIGIIEAPTGPNGMEPQDVPPQFKI